MRCRSLETAWQNESMSSHVSLRPSCPGRLAHISTVNDTSCARVRARIRPCTSRVYFSLRVTATGGCDWRGCWTNGARPEAEILSSRWDPRVKYLSPRLVFMRTCAKKQLCMNWTSFWGESRYPKAPLSRI